MKKYLFLTIASFVWLIGCKTSKSKVETADGFTRVGDKNANYIPYYLKVTEADSLHIVGEYKRSFEILDSLFKKYEPLNQSAYIEYVTYLKNKVLLKDFDRVDMLLKNCIQNYGYKVEYVLRDTVLKVVIDKSKFTVNDLNGFYKNYGTNLDLEYRNTLENMIENDQRVRLAVPKNPEEWKRVDRENAEAIKLLIAEKGYPSAKKVGGMGFSDKGANVRTLFMHASTQAREDYILELMFDALKKGECAPQDFATHYDKYVLVKGTYGGDKVLYGEIRDKKKTLDMLVVNPAKLDSVRKSIGLESFNYMQWKLKMYTGRDF